MISLNNLVVEFGAGAGAVRAVDGVSLEVASGEVYGLVGESGCGKSTVLRVLAGLNASYRGEVRLGGQALPQKRDKTFHKQVQMVFQDPYGSLHPRQSVNTQLMEPILIHQLDNAHTRITGALESVGLSQDFRFRYPHELSGGQRQRIAIARVLVLEPEVLLLDEPTSALDVSVQAEVLNLLADLREARGLTYLLVSHDLGVVAHMCERLAVMERGRIVEEMSRDRLVQADVQHPYTKRLLEASDALGEGRAVVEAGR